VHRPEAKPSDMARVATNARSLSAPGGSARWLSLIAVLLLLTAFEFAYWNHRVLEAAHYGQRAGDIYTEHYPVFDAGFGRLREGEFPLWNPDQLGGLPFMAIPYSGLLYPGNAAYLWLDDTALAIEVTEVVHLVFGGVCMWLLIRLLGMSWLSGLAAAMTVMMSGSIALQINFPVLVQGMMWLPATILAVEHTLRGGRFAPPCLAGVVALQVLNGSTEFLVYNLYAAGLFALFALTRDAATGHVRGAMMRGAVLMAAVLLGVGLAGVQLLPSLELVAESARAGGASLITFYHSTVSPAELLVGVLGSSGAVGVGVLPLLGVCLGGSLRGRPNGRRTLWLYALTLATAAALLAAGGTIFELYSQTPIGSLFRRPNKLLHLWAFAGGLLAALAIAQLEQWRTQALSPRALRSRIGWRVAFGVSTAGAFGAAIGGSQRRPADLCNRRSTRGPERIDRCHGRSPGCGSLLVFEERRAASLYGTSTTGSRTAALRPPRGRARRGSGPSVGRAAPRSGTHVQAGHASRRPRRDGQTAAYDEPPSALSTPGSGCGLATGGQRNAHAGGRVATARPHEHTLLRPEEG